MDIQQLLAIIGAQQIEIISLKQRVSELETQLKQKDEN